MGFSGKLLTAMPMLALMVTAALAEGDAEKGENVFKKCKACHKVGEGATNGTGPLLNDVIGRVAGTAEGFSYSPSLVAAGEAGLTWDEETIAQFIEDPKAFLQTYLDDSGAKSKMAYKLKKDSDREDVAAYVATFSAPVEAEGEEASD